jgi:DNA-binding transcriptional regulator YiaG
MSLWFFHNHNMETELDIKEIRRALDMTQAQLGEEVGVDQSTVSNWETGTSPRGPARKLLSALAAKAAKRKAIAASEMEKAS